MWGQHGKSLFLEKMLVEECVWGNIIGKNHSADKLEERFAAA